MFTLQDIQLETDAPTYKKALKLHEDGLITKYIKGSFRISAEIRGTDLYDAWIDIRNYETGDCTCYLGQNGYICKHMIALAIHYLLKNNPSQNTKAPADDSDAFNVVHELRELTKEEEVVWKEDIKKAMTYIKSYTGPSKGWFLYQNKLDAGTKAVRIAIAKLPISKTSAKLLITLALKLDTKLQIGGIDDSNGTVGNCIEYIVETLINFSMEDASVVKEFKKLEGIQTCFGWEEQLLRIKKEFFQER